MGDLGPPEICKDGHEWVVYSTAVCDGCLLVQCVECGAMGTVDYPTKKEWSEAYNAPSRPYRWLADRRVDVWGFAAPHVIRATKGPRCECYSRLGRLSPGTYERIPGDIMTPLDGLDVRARGELGQLAELVGRSDLCSLLFPHFIRGVEEHYGMRHSDAVNEVADRIEKIHTLGLHLSPGVVAKVLRDFAGRNR